MDYRKVDAVTRWQKEDGSWHEFSFDAEARDYANWYHVLLEGDLDRWNNSSVYSHYYIIGDDKFAITAEQLAELEAGRVIVVDLQGRGRLHVRPKTPADQPRQPWWSSWWEYFTDSYERPSCSCGRS